MFEGPPVGLVEDLSDKMWHPRITPICRRIPRRPTESHSSTNSFFFLGHNEFVLYDTFCWRNSQQGSVASAELFKRSEFVVPISLKRHLIDIKFLVVGKIPPRGLCHEEADQQIGYVSNAVLLPDALWDHPDVCDHVTFWRMFVVLMIFLFMTSFGTPPGHTERDHGQLRIFLEQLRDDTEMILHPGLCARLFDFMRRTGMERTLGLMGSNP